MSEIKTFLLENDNWFWSGLEDFCKNFDPNFKVLGTSPQLYMERDDYMFVGMLSQPTVERLIVASSFETQMFLPHIERDEYWQLEHYVKLIEYAYKVREHLELGGLTVEVNYHGVDFIQDIKKQKWGWDCTKLIQRFVRQNPENLTINIYQEYQFQYRLTEENIY